MRWGPVGCKCRLLESECQFCASPAIQWGARVPASDLFCALSRCLASTGAAPEWRLSSILLITIVICAAAIECASPAMPHCRSPQRRKERAKARAQYVRPCPEGYGHVLTRSCVLPQAKVVVKSLEVHADLNLVAGRPFHHLWQTALAAGDQKALVLSRVAGRAKHHWPALRCPGKWADIAPFRPSSTLGPSGCVWRRG